MENNSFVNVADAEKLRNSKADRPVGLETPLKQWDFHGVAMVCLFSAERT